MNRWEGATLSHRNNASGPSADSRGLTGTKTIAMPIQKKSEKLVLFRGHFPHSPASTSKSPSKVFHSKTHPPKNTEGISITRAVNAISGSLPLH